jgi:hypothetical protein
MKWQVDEMASGLKSRNDKLINLNANEIAS